MQEQFTQHPILAALDGGKGLSQAELDDQERQACADMAAGAVKALTRLHPMHPRRQDYLQMLADYRQAAGPHHSRAIGLAGLQPLPQSSAGQAGRSPAAG